ncbi:hypothetical protein [Kordiimonas aestuarii]|uniref:hypothetical protein n=1 Tax=Kordiimonas aestuarii TaxID=1005925 RepID=UPI0021D2F575|nr:hypothetical protein [Kordiimonas aestuarii]
MRTLATILIGGSIAGTLDILYAISAYSLRGVKPMVILQSVASGVQGAQAYSGGGTSAALGLGLHFFMTTLMALIYVLAAQVFPILTTRPVMTGAAYGVLLYLVMNYVVVPLSLAVPGRPPEGWYILGALFAHLCLVGVPIALTAAKFGK